jgi:hypothetical protein
MLDLINDETRPRHKDMEKEARLVTNRVKVSFVTAFFVFFSMLGEVLRLFQDGVLLMDEVSVLL